jgi:Ser/Thr protein kinase RdoA (MazF antagonist)
MEVIALDWHRVAARFFSKAYTVTALGISSGYSGSRFALVQDATGGKWCLRRWPREMSEARLQFIHRTLLHSHSNGFAGVPALQRTLGSMTFIRRKEYLYDVQAWMPGKPLGKKQTFGNSIPNVGCHLDEKRLIHLASVLATFHLSITGLRPLEAAEVMPLAQRFTRLKEEFETFRDRVTTGIHQADHKQSLLVGKWLERLPRLLSLAGTLIVAHPQAAQSTSTLCHGDLWPQHVFFDRGRFIGFADFESLCFSSPTVDVAQLILHFADWNARDRVTQVYRNRRSLSREEITLLPAAAALDLVSEGCWAIEALHLNGDNPRQRRAHHNNLRRLFPSVELILQQSDMSFDLSSG